MKRILFVLIALCTFVQIGNAQPFKNGMLGHSYLSQSVTSTDMVLRIAKSDTIYFPLGRQKIKLSKVNVQHYEIVNISGRTTDSLIVESRNSESGSFLNSWSLGTSVDLVITNGQIAYMDSTGGSGGSGSVTSVNVTVPSILAVSGVPITTTGTAAITLQTQTTNKVLASPNGSTGVPTFRALVGTDIPTLNQNTTGSSANFTGSLVGDVTGTQGATTVGKINGNTIPANASGALTNNGSGTLTWTPAGGGGTTTSVGFATNAPWLTVTGSPVTTSGTLTANLTTGLGANLVLATPNGSTGTVGTRALVSADIPTLNQNTTGTAANVTGTVATTNGGTGITTVGTNGQVLTSNGTTLSYQTPTASPYFAAFPSSPVTSPTAGTHGQGHIAIGDSALIGDYLSVIDSGNFQVAIGQSLIAPFNVGSASNNFNNQIVAINGSVTSGKGIAIGTGPRVLNGKLLNGGTQAFWAGAHQMTGSNSNSIAMGYDSRTGVGSSSGGESGLAIFGTAGTSSLAINDEVTGEYGVGINAPGHSGDDASANGCTRIASGGDNNFHGFTGSFLLGSSSDLHMVGTMIAATQSSLDGLGAIIYGHNYGGVGAPIQLGGLQANGAREEWHGWWNTPSESASQDTTPRTTNVIFGIGEGVDNTHRANILTLTTDTTLTINNTQWTTNSSKLNVSAIKGGTNTYILTSNGPTVPPTWQANAGGTGGGLTSVGITTDRAWITIGSSPLTANGTITLNGTTGLTANQILATPNGSTGTVGLRSLVLADLPTINVATGGSGRTSTTAYSVICGGTTSTGVEQSVSGVGTSGQVLTSNGTGALPTWAAAGGIANAWTAFSTSTPATAPVVGGSSTGQMAIGSGAIVTGTYDGAISFGYANCSGTNATAINNRRSGYADPLVDHFGALAAGPNCGAQGNQATNLNSPLTSLTASSTFALGGYGASTISQIASGTIGGFATISGEGSVNVSGGTSNGATLPNWITADHAVTLGGWSDTIRGFGGVIAGGVGNSILDGGFGGFGTADCFVTGSNNIAACRYQFVCGAYNTQIGTQGAYDPTFPLFIIGNGTSNSSRSNALTISGNGDVKIAGALDLTIGTNKAVVSGTLVAGTLTISNSLITSTDIVEVQDYGGGAMVGHLYISAQSSGSVTVSSTNVGDTNAFKIKITHTH